MKTTFNLALVNIDDYSATQRLVVSLASKTNSGWTHSDRIWIDFHADCATPADLATWLRRLADRLEAYVPPTP